MASTAINLGEALLAANLHSQTRQDEASTSRREPTIVPLTVAITREAGTDAGQVATQLGKRLGWPVYDRELLNRIAGEMGTRARVLESLDEKRSSWLLTLFEAFASTTPITAGAYADHLARVAFALAASGECILIGRGTAQFLPAESTLRVRLVAPLENRIDSIQRRENLSRSDAARRVADIDRARTEFVRSIFHKDPADPAGYDLILNTSRFDPVECAELIEHAVRIRTKTHATPRSPA
jgi:cytidylate kinase